MPELPEVETVVKALRPQLIGRKVTDVHSTWPRHIDRPALAELKQCLPGSTFVKVYRRGKFLVFQLAPVGNLIVHLRMSGHLSVVDVQTPYDKHEHTFFVLDNGQELRFRDIRKFGRVYYVLDENVVLGNLGPEPLEPEFTAAKLKTLIADRKRILKPFLLDQHVIAGIGNIYADEALFHAGILPARRTDTLTSAEIVALHAGIQAVLRTGIEREGASISTYVKPDGEKGDMQNAVMVFRRTGNACYRCGHPIQRIVLGGRSTHFCAHCQV